MQVTLYRFTGRETECDKLSNCTQLYNADITPYGAFNSAAVRFRLDTQYNANFCKYVYNGKTYYGSVVVNVDSEGLFVYDVSIDALSTCWYAGCFSTQGRIVRSPSHDYYNGSSTVKKGLVYDDPMFPVKPKPKIGVVDYTPSDTNIPCVLMQVMQPSNCKYTDPNAAKLSADNDFISEGTDNLIAGQYVYIKYYSEFINDGAASTNKPVKYSYELQTYCLTLDEFNYFYHHYLTMNDDEQKAIAGLITKLSIGCSDWFGKPSHRSGWISYKPTTEYFAGIPFISIGSSNLYFVPIHSSYSTKSAALAASPRCYTHLYNGSDIHEVSSSTFSQFIDNFDAYYKQKYIFHLPYTNGTIQLDWTNLPIIEQGSGLLTLYRAFDPGSFILKYIPAVKYTTTGGIQRTIFLNHFATEGRVSQEFPILADTAVANWTSTIISALTTVAMIIATVATEGATAPWLIASAGGTAASIASTAHQEQTAATTVVGVTGGCAYFGMSQPPCIEVLTWTNDLMDGPGAEIYAIQDTFGIISDIYTSNLQDYISHSYAGLWQLIQPRLKANSYERYIVDQAEAISQQGFYLNTRLT